MFCKMLLMMTWMLFWKLYGLVVVCLMAIPIIGSLRSGSERYPPLQQSRKEPEKMESDQSTLPNEVGVEANYIIPLQLRIWGPENPPVVKARANTQAHPNCHKDKVLMKIQETGKKKKRSEQNRSDVLERPNRQIKISRRGLREIAVELAACLNGVAENTTTERELYKAMRLVMRQHPSLRSLHYDEALQALLWTEDDYTDFAIISMALGEEW